MLLLFLAVLPVIIICAYIYRLDRAEQEPLTLLTLSIFYGSLLTGAIIPCEVYIIDRLSDHTQPFYAFYMSFIAIAPVEEGFKFTVLYLLLGYNSNLNEPFDGIVYAVFISLGFALIENIFYVFNPHLGGYTTAFLRAVFSVPGHGIFGVFMGYYFSIACIEKKTIYTFYSIIYPYILHSIYDFILFVKTPLYFLPFFTFIIYLWVKSNSLINKHIQRSPFI